MDFFLNRFTYQLEHFVCLYFFLRRRPLCCLEWLTLECDDFLQHPLTLYTKSKLNKFQLVIKCCFGKINPKSKKTKKKQVFKSWQSHHQHRHLHKVGFYGLQLTLEWVSCEITSVKTLAHKQSNKQTYIVGQVMQYICPPPVLLAMLTPNLKSSQNLQRPHIVAVGHGS